RTRGRSSKTAPRTPAHLTSTGPVIAPQEISRLNYPCLLVCPPVTTSSGFVAALRHGQRVGALLVEAERVDAVNHELAGRVRAQRLQDLGGAVPRHGGDHDAAAPGAVGGAGPEDHPLARPGQPVREAAPLVARPAQHPTTRWDTSGRAQG